MLASDAPLTLDQARKLAPALRSEDPLAVRLAQDVLHDRFDGQGALEHWRVLKGDIEGPTWFLESKLKQLRESELENDGWRELHQDVIVPFLDYVRDLPEVPERLLRVVTHLWTAFSRRASQKLESDTRAQEPVEVDKDLARRCEELVRGWIDRGQAEGDLAALRRVAPRRPIPVRGRRLLLPVRGKPPQGDVAALVRWAETAPALKSTPALTALIKAPSQRELLQPHLAQLREQTARALATSELGTDGRIGSLLREYYTALVAAFPETLDADLVAGQMIPMVLSDEVQANSEGHNLIYPLWENRPDLVAPVVDAITRAPREVWLPDSRGWLVSKAIQLHGYQPTPRQTDWIASWLYQPLGPHGERRHRNHDDYQWAARELMKLDLTDLKEPDRSGREVPIREAVLDKLLDVKLPDEMLELHGAGVELAFSQPGLRDRTLSAVEKALDQAGSVESLSLEDKARLVLVHGSAGRLPSLASRMAAELERPQTDRATRRVVDDYRQAYLEAGTTREKLREYLRVNALYYSKPPEVDGIVAVESHLNSRVDTEIFSRPQIEAFAPDRPDQTLGEFRGAFTQGGTLENLSPDGVGALQILDHLSGRDPALRRTLLETLHDELVRPEWQDPHVFNRMLRRMRDERFEQCLAGISTEPGGLASLDEARAVAEAANDRDQQEKVWETFEKVCKADTRLPRVDLEGEELLDLYRMLADDDRTLYERNCDRFKAIASRVGGDVELARRIYAEASQNGDWDLGYRRALARELGIQSSGPAGKIVIEKDFIRVGSVVLKRRSWTAPAGT